MIAPKKKWEEGRDGIWRAEAADDIDLRVYPPVFGRNSYVWLVTVGADALQETKE